MDPKSFVKVGLLVIVALGLAYGVTQYLSHVRPDSYKVTVKFADVKGLNKGAAVRLSGVNIGEVSDTKFDSDFKVIVTLSIDKKYDIPQDATFDIAAGLLISSPQIEVHPDPKDLTPPLMPKDGSASGKSAAQKADLADTVSNLNATVIDLRTRMGGLTGKLSTLLDDTHKLVNTSQQTIGAARNIIADPKLKTALVETATNFRDVSRDAAVTSKDLSRQLRDFVKSGKGKVDKLADTAIALSTKLGDTIDDAREVVKKLTDQVSDPRLQQSLQETVELARSTLASVRQITSDLHQVTGDPTLTKNIKETVSNLNEASVKGRDALDKLDSLLGRFTKSADKAGKVSFPRTETLGNVSEHVDPSRLRVDVDARFNLNRSSLLDIGLFDLGQSNRFNLQYGNRFGEHLLTRYGIYASKLGAGVEYQPAGNFGLRADLYDTNRLRLDVRGLFRVNNNASIWVGEEGIFRSPVPAIGIQFKP